MWNSMALLIWLVLFSLPALAVMDGDREMCPEVYLRIESAKLDHMDSIERGRCMGEPRCALKGYVDSASGDPDCPARFDIVDSGAFDGRTADGRQPLTVEIPWPKGSGGMSQCTNALDAEYKKLTSEQTWWCSAGRRIAVKLDEGSYRFVDSDKRITGKDFGSIAIIREDPNPGPFDWNKARQLEIYGDRPPPSLTSALSKTIGFESPRHVSRKSPIECKVVIDWIGGLQAVREIQAYESGRNIGHGGCTLTSWNYRAHAKVVSSEPYGAKPEHCPAAGDEIVISGIDYERKPSVCKLIPGTARTVCEGDPSELGVVIPAERISGTTRAARRKSCLEIAGALPVPGASFMSATGDKIQIRKEDSPTEWSVSPGSPSTFARLDGTAGE